MEHYQGELLIVTIQTVPVHNVYFIALQCMSEWAHVRYDI